MHVSVPIDQTIEFINVTQVSPLISKCQIKVCYVGEQANRNGTVITKELATQFGAKLPGSPIVGYFNEDSQDFEQHNREVEIKDGKFAIVDVTKPYGFVDINAKVWFQKFLDDGQVEREYLVTEGYIWTEAYPESKRIIEQGNNQSLEFNKDSVKGYWSGNVNSNNRFFIINEALIEKLCILGEDFEPCFEGSQIKTQFSLEDQFAELKNTMYSMMNELKEALNKGGSNTPMAEEIKTPVEEQPVVETPAEEYKAPEKEEKPAEGKEEPENKSEDNSDKKGSDKTEDKSEDDDKKSEDEKKEEYKCGDGEEPKKKYNLEEVTEYTELQEKFDTLTNNYSALETERDNLLAEIEPLRAFKLEKDRADKQAMIDSFYMLSDEDKSDVTTNIDTYSLNDIEAKLAVICVRNKVNFSLDEDKNEDKPEMTFNLNSAEKQENNAPAWVQAVRQVASNM